MSTDHKASPEAECHGPVVMARCCTTIALPAYIYNNGTAGVGATITLNANAALPTIDGVTLVVGDVVKHNNGASFADNGLYLVTALGDGATTPGVLTRDPRADTQNKILSLDVKIREGNSRRGAVYEYKGNPSITMGTTALSWVRKDSNRGLNEYAESPCDFEGQTAALTNGLTMSGPWPGFATITGAGASIAPKLVTSPTQRGVFTFSTGTTTTGVATLSFAATPRPFMIDAAQYFELEVIAAGPSAFSDGTDTFRMLIGLASAINTAAADLLAFEYTQATSTRWMGTARASSVSSTTGNNGPAVATTTYVRGRMVKYAGESVLHVFFGDSEVAIAAGNVPLGVALTPLVTITKSAGTTARTFDIDTLRVIQAYPNGRA